MRKIYYLKNKRTHDSGWVNISAWWMGKGEQRQRVVGLAVNELRLEFLMQTGMGVLISAKRKIILSQKKGLMVWGGSIDLRCGWARVGKGNELLGWRLMSNSLNS